MRYRSPAKRRLDAGIRPTHAIAKSKADAPAKTRIKEGRHGSGIYMALAEGVIMEAAFRA